MKGQRRARLWQFEQLRTKLVVQPGQLANRLGRKPAQETAQGGGIGKFLESDQGEKQSIVLQHLGFADPRKTGDQNKKKDQREIGRMIIAPVGRRLENTFQPSAQTQLVAKPLNQEQSAEVRQGLRFKRKLQCLQAFSHGGRKKKYVGCVPPITGRFARLLAQARNLTFYRKHQAFLRTIYAWRAFFRLNGECFV